MLDLAQAEVDVVIARLTCDLPGPSHHLRRHVHADDATRRADFPGRQEAVEAAARPQVEDGFPLLQGGEGHRVAATQTQVGPFRHAAHLLLGVPYFPARRFGRGRAAARPARLAARSSRPGDAGVLLPYVSADFVFVHPRTPFVSRSGGFLPSSGRAPP